nr:MAG TPA: hypothetical protein [Caudoviricetes sp.]
MQTLYQSYSLYRHPFLCKTSLRFKRFLNRSSKSIL